MSGPVARPRTKKASGMRIGRPGLESRRVAELHGQRLRRHSFRGVEEDGHHLAARSPVGRLAGRGAREDVVDPEALRVGEAHQELGRLARELDRPRAILEVEREERRVPNVVEAQREHVALAPDDLFQPSWRAWAGWRRPAGGAASRGGRGSRDPGSTGSGRSTPWAGRPGPRDRRGGTTRRARRRSDGRSSSYREADKGPRRRAGAGPRPVTVKPRLRRYSPSRPSSAVRSSPWSAAGHRR